MSNSETGEDKVVLNRASALLLASNTPKGRGVVAGRDIESGTIIETCPVLILSPEENTKYVEKTTLYNYTYNWPSRDSNGNPTKTQAVVFGLGSMFNHSKDHQNVGWKRDLDRDLIIYYALRNIRQGEELCISYGDRLTFEDVEQSSNDNSEESAEEHLGKIELT